MVRRSPPNSPAFDALAVDGGWLTPEGIATAAGDLRVESVRRSLQRWRGEGLVEDRVVELARSGAWGPVQTRTEWKVSPRGHSL